MYKQQINPDNFVLFLLTIMLSVLLRYIDSDYPYGIFKLYLSNIWRKCGTYHYGI